MSPRLRVKVENGNILCDFAVRMPQAVSESNAIGILECPEDLGIVVRGIPASIWQRQDIRALPQKGSIRAAVYPGDIPPVYYLRSTGLLTHAATSAAAPHAHVGWQRV